MSRPSLYVVTNDRPAVREETENSRRLRFMRRVLHQPGVAERLDDDQLTAAIEWCERVGPSFGGDRSLVVDRARTVLTAVWLRRGPSLREAHAETMRNADKGVDCPCCGRYVKRYAHTLNAGRARALAWLVGASRGGREWVHVPSKGPRWLVKTNQHPTLAWWELVERREHDGTDDGLTAQGWYRPTQRGVDFAHGRIRVPRKVHTYNGDVLEVSDEMTTIATAAGERFDIAEEMDAGGVVPLAFDRLTTERRNNE